MPGASSLTALETRVAQELLHSTLVARLAYSGLDGKPRLVPIWFHWTGDRLVLATPAGAAKVKALRANGDVAITIDDPTWPYRSLEFRGVVEVETVESVVPEYRLAAQRYLGASRGATWINHIESLFPPMARLTVRPTWVRVMELQQLLPDAVAATLERSSSS
jgi:PPOX class probable F420-dependent enzyme